jgi:hypothetical protein
MEYKPSILSIIHADGRKQKVDPKLVAKWNNRADIYHSAVPKFRSFPVRFSRRRRRQSIPTVRGYRRAEKSYVGGGAG